jgi:hypothetical protein
LADGDERSREATCDKRLIYFSSHFMFFTKQFSSSMATNDAQAGTVIPGLFVSPLPVETPFRSIAGPWSYSPISRGFERARLAGTPFLFCFFARSTRVVGSCESPRCSLAGARVTLPVQRSNSFAGGSAHRLSCHAPHRRRIRRPGDHHRLASATRRASRPESLTVGP